MKVVLEKFMAYLHSSDASDTETISNFIRDELPVLMTVEVNKVLKNEEQLSLQKAQAMALFYAGQAFGLETKVKTLETKLSDYAFDFCNLDGCEGVSTKCWKTCPNSQYNVYAKEKIKVHDAELIEAVQEEMDTQVTARGMISEEKVISILIEKSKKLIKKLDEVQPE